jgi:hypothetical protein
MMSTTEYDRGFAAAFEYARLLVLTAYIPLDDSAKRLNDLLDQTLQDAMRDAETDPEALRRRLLAIWHNQPKLGAEVVSLDTWRTLKGAA